MGYHTQMQYATEAFVKGEGSVPELAKKYNVPYKALLIKTNFEMFSRNKEIEDRLGYDYGIKNSIRNKEYVEKLNQFLNQVQTGRLGHHNRTYAAADCWWSFRGNVPAALIAHDFDVRVSALTFLIQNQISEKTDVEIPNDTPQVIVYNTKEDIDAKYPPQPYASRAMTVSLELFYTIANAKSQTA